jgi:hypothetical protein
MAAKFPTRSAPAMQNSTRPSSAASFFSEMARFAALYFRKKRSHAPGPTNTAGARYRCVRSNVVRSAATQDAKASGERCERAMDGERGLVRAHTR